MPDVPLPTGFKGLEQLARTKERLINLFNTGQNQIIRMPGVATFATGIGACRGMEFFGDRIYQVDGNDFVDGDAFLEIIHGAPGRLRLLVERDGRLRTVVLRMRGDARPNVI